MSTVPAGVETRGTHIHPAVGILLSACLSDIQSTAELVGLPDQPIADGVARSWLVYKTNQHQLCAASFAPAAAHQQIFAHALSPSKASVAG